MIEVKYPIAQICLKYSEGPIASIIKGIFKLLGGVSRCAYFETFAAYCEPGSEPIIFNGRMRGEITTKIFNTSKEFDFMPYDRIFVPEGKKITISNMTMDQKNQLSQRSKAFRKLGEFLNNKNLNKRFS